jgi:hypothetical protein
MSTSEEFCSVPAIMLVFSLDEKDSRWDRLIGSESCVLQDVIHVFHLQDPKGTTGQLAATQVYVLDDHSLFLFLVSKFDGIAFVASFLSHYH